MRYIFICIICLSMFAEADAQMSLDRKVQASGALATASDNYMHKATLGQAITGINYNETNISLSGFWYRKEYRLNKELSVRIDEEFVKFSYGPNPCTGKLRISGETELSGRVRLIVRNSMGINVHELNLGNNSCIDCEIDLSGLPNGAYFCSIEQSGRFANFRIVIIR